MLDFLMSDKVLNFDLSVFQAVDSIRSGALDVIMEIITRLGDAGIIWILLGLVLFISKKYRKIGFTVLVALIVMVVCNDGILKNLIARTRPHDMTLDWWTASYTFPNLVPMEDSFSFPSGHASSSFAAAFALLWYNRKYGIPALVFAFIMAFSRIYVGVHYCTDIIAGFVVGLIYAIIGIIAAKLLFPYVEKIVNALTEKLKAKKNKEG